MVEVIIMKRALIPNPSIIIIYLPLLVMYLGTSFYIEPGDGTEVQELDYAGHSCVTVIAMLLRFLVVSYTCCLTRTLYDWRDRKRGRKYRPFPICLSQDLSVNISTTSLSFNY